MRDERELNIDELSAVVGGAKDNGGFHPTPPDNWIIKLIKSVLNPPPPK
jgi:bacteriocin-like protein